jgi:hypothetical protein
VFAETFAPAVIIGEEDGRRTLTTMISTAKGPITTAVVMLETVLALTNQRMI